MCRPVLLVLVVVVLLLLLGVVQGVNCSAGVHSPRAGLSCRQLMAEEKEGLRLPPLKLLQCHLVPQGVWGVRST
jgi:hypothetical protein